MNYDLQLHKIEDTRRKTLEVVAELDDKLARKEIDGIQHQIMMHDKLLGKTVDEVLAYLDSEKKKIFEKIDREKTEEINQNSSRKKTTTLAITAILLIACIGLLFMSENNLTGFIIKEFNTITSSDITANELYQQTLEYNNISGLKISGTIDKGSANIKLLTQEGLELNVGTITAENVGETYSLTTDKKVYALGEQVNITLTPNNAQTSTYVYYGEDSSIVNDGIFQPQTIGEYKIVVVITDGVQTARLELNFTVAETSTEEAQETVTTSLGAENIFTDLCVETCNISVTSNPTLIIEPLDGATVIINDITTTTYKENNAPLQVITIRDIEINVGEEQQIDLSRYFQDADLDTIYYDIMSTQKVTTNIEGDTLTITGVEPGEENANVYATDSTEITTSNEFKITVSAVMPVILENSSNETNTTIDLNQTIESNLTENETNSSNDLNQTINSTIDLNVTVNSTNISVSSCDLPLEERPTICFEGEEAKFFKDIVASLTNDKGNTVARFNRFGNLIISGELVENSVAEPSNLDFKIGYSETVDYDERIIITAWIDSKTGDLHLKGKLYEEQQTLNAPLQNSYTVDNKLRITVAYFDKITGDLYLRGNLVRSGKV